MSLENSAERFFDLFDLGDDGPNFISSVPLRVKEATEYLLLSFVVFDRDLENGLETALNGGYLGGMEAIEQWRITTGEAAYSACRPRVLCVEAVEEQAVQGSWGLVGCKKW